MTADVADGSVVDDVEPSAVDDRLPERIGAHEAPVCGREPYPAPMANRQNERILRAMHLASEISTVTEHVALGLN